MMSNIPQNPGVPPTATGVTPTTTAPGAVANPPTSIPQRSESHSKKSTAAHNLRRAWRGLASTLVVAVRRADGAAKAMDSLEEHRRQAQVNPAAVSAAQNAAVVSEKAKKEMNDAISTTLKAREELKKVATMVEGTLRGNAREAEALQLCFKSQPCVGRKRKRTLGLVGNNATEGEEASKKQKEGPSGTSAQ